MKHTSRKNPAVFLMFHPMRLMMLAIFFFTLGHANAQNTITESTRGSLIKQINLLNLIERDVEHIDLVRILLLKKNAQEVVQAIEEHGTSHMQSMQGLQRLVLMYRFSHAFFSQIETPYTSNAIKLFKEISEQLMRIHGMEESAHSQITAGIFTQMHRLIQQMRELPLNDDLRKELEALVPDLGRLIATATQGDRPLTFQASTSILEKVTLLYPKFNEIASSSAAFTLSLEIQGLCEFYGDFAQVELP